MQVKLFEVRDRATLIPCFGILMAPTEGAARWREDRYLLSRAGFDFENPLVIFGRLEGGGCEHDPYSWSVPPRTVAEAHRYVSENWDRLQSGAVIDVEFILDEVSTPKVSERTR